MVTRREEKERKKEKLPTKLCILAVARLSVQATLNQASWLLPELGWVGNGVTRPLDWMVPAKISNGGVSCCQKEAFFFYERTRAHDHKTSNYNYYNYNLHLQKTNYGLHF